MSLGSARDFGDGECSGVCAENLRNAKTRFRQVGNTKIVSTGNAISPSLVFSVKSVKINEVFDFIGGGEPLMIVKRMNNAGTCRLE
ncbi:MAG: hypothetical protein LBJ67_10290 [Planctomycetaceae bacterium]|nr:hypothetical protein [Planctomycetaceae bacterium]